MPAVAARLLLVTGLLVSTVGAIAVNRRPDLIVHEWGTFTTVAGQDGRAIEWLPLGGPQDLPCFVERFKSPEFKALLGDAPLNYERARGALRGTVRMETPVIYFYAAREARVNVAVRFPQGLMSEWYPRALVQQPNAYASVLRDGAQSWLTWKDVLVRPGATPRLPNEGRPSHYYAARETDAAPVQVAGQDEKFLFYRGVGGFEVPIATTVLPDGSVKVANRHARGAAIPAVILFENRDGRIGFRMQSNVKGEITLQAPELTGKFDVLADTLERMLTSTGLYLKEARAMVNTWRDSWFEPGTRVFYLLPRDTVEDILPLTLTPRPGKIARAFIGRMEVFTPATLKEVRDAIAEGDEAALAPYARFLEPIAQRIVGDLAPAVRARTAEALESVYARYVKPEAGVCK